MRKRLLAAICILALGASSAALGAEGPAETLPPSVPVGFAVIPQAAVATPTSLSITPDGSALYVSSYVGSIVRFPLTAGIVSGPSTIFLSDLTSPLGVLATNDGVFVATNGPGSVQYNSISYIEGAVSFARDTNDDGKADNTEVVLRGLPTGRHQTNGMAIGPGGKLYITNGNSTDSGFGAEGGPPEARPYSGSILSVSPSDRNLTASSSMVVATGMRNVFDIAFAPSGHPAVGKAFVPMNGPDGLTYVDITRPEGEDTLNVFTPGGPVEHFGFPWCLYDRNNGGLNGFAQDPSEGSCDPLTPSAFNGLPSGVGVAAKPSALFGHHVSANGLEFNPGGSFPAIYSGDLFVTEFGNFFGDSATGHKIVRVSFDSSGSVTTVIDFMTSIVPLDLTFAPDGSMWVADFGGAIYKVSGLLP